VTHFTDFIIISFVKIPVFYGSTGTYIRKIKYILNTMADPNEFGEQEMMGSFVEEGHEY
jgi:hypothetical protein